MTFQELRCVEAMLQVVCTVQTHCRQQQDAAMESEALQAVESISKGHGSTS